MTESPETRRTKKVAPASASPWLRALKVKEATPPRATVCESGRCLGDHHVGQWALDRQPALSWTADRPSGSVAVATTKRSPACSPWTVTSGPSTDTVARDGAVTAAPRVSGSPSGSEKHGTKVTDSADIDGL